MFRLQPPRCDDPPFEWVMLGMSAMAVALAFCLRVGADGRQVLLADWALPELCLARSWLGISCFGCGLTRSWIAMAHGQLLESWNYHPVGGLLFVAAACQIPYRSWKLWAGRGHVIVTTDDDFAPAVLLPSSADDATP